MIALINVQMFTNTPVLDKVCIGLHQKLQELKYLSKG